MVREIIHDPLLLARKSAPATEKDRQIITDLKDTLEANRDRCVGMAANMIGEMKRVIVFLNGPLPMIMVNPVIRKKTRSPLSRTKISTPFTNSTADPIPTGSTAAHSMFSLLTIHEP